MSPRYVVKWNGLYADGSRNWCNRSEAYVFADGYHYSARDFAFLHAMAFPDLVPAPRVVRLVKKGSKS